MKNSKKYLITITAMLSVLLIFASCGGKDVDTYTEKNGETESISAEFFDTDSPDTDINSDEISLPQEDDFSNTDFVIEKGVLVKYLGEDAVVSVPDIASEIGEYAFSHSPSPENITEIRLGKNVSKISAKAFFELDALIKVETGENPYFEEYYYDNRDIYPLDGEYFPTIYALSSFYQPIIFCFGYELDGILDFLTETDYYIEKENITIAISDALFDIKINEGTFGYYCVLNDITYENYIKEFDSFSLDGVYRFRAFETKEAFVFTRASSNFAEAYLFACGEIFEMKGTTDYTIRFFKKDDQLKYCKMPCKYSDFTNGHGVTNFFLVYNEIMSRTEFCSEYGLVEIDENGLVYKPERTYNLSEHLLMLGKEIDECFEKYYCEGEYDTLDELIEANVKRLEKENDNKRYKVNESEILAFFDMTFGEIINAGYELNYLYSYQGPGAPVYELDSEIGVLLMFSAEEADEYKIQDDSKPYRIIINNPNIELFGLKIGMLSEDENKVISEWDHSGSDFLHIGVYYTKKTIDDYSITAFREATIEDLKIFCLKNNITFSEEDYKSDFVQYEIIPMFAKEERINPRSNILSLEIEKINKKGEK